MLTLLVLIPIIGVITIFLLPDKMGSPRAKKLGLIFSLLALWISVFI